MINSERLHVVTQLVDAKRDDKASDRETLKCTDQTLVLSSIKKQNNITKYIYAQKNKESGETLELVLPSH